MNNDSSLRNEYLPPGVFDPLASDGSVGPVGPGASVAVPSQAGTPARTNQRPPLLHFHTLRELSDYVEPANQNMAGDYHLQRGAISILAGPPGCGKSRATLALALAGARGEGDWLGLKIHCRFKTMILQNENGLARLHRDIPKDIDHASLEGWIRISEPPTVGLAIHNQAFREELTAAVREFRPNLMIFDPFNATTRDSMERDFTETLAGIREILAEADSGCAALIIHHLRKPKSDDRQRGRTLSNLLAGSYVLTSVARAILVMQPATDDTEDNRVIVTPSKNNDGEHGPRTAWRRANGRFEPITDFDWSECNAVQATPEAKVKLEHLEQLFENGVRKLPLSTAASELKSIANVGRSAAYAALKLDGRMGKYLTKTPDGLLSLSTFATQHGSSATDGVEID